MLFIPNPQNDPKPEDMLNFLTGSRLTRRRLLYFAMAFGVVAPLVSLTGCGGGKSSFLMPGAGTERSTNPIPLTIGRADIILELPQGFTYPPAQMILVNSLGNWPVIATGVDRATANAGIFLEGDALATLTLADGTPVLSGWLGSEQKTLSVSTTAQVLLHLALLAPLHTPDALEVFFTALESSPAVPPLAEAIRAMLVANPAALGQERTGVAPALANALAQINASRQITRSLLIDPDANERKSGVQVVQGSGINTVKAINHYRLRRLAFVDRVSYVPVSGGASVNSAASVNKFDISATQKLTGVFTGISDGVIAMFGYGNSPLAEIQTSPVALPLFPDDAKETLYQVKVVGPAGLYTPEEEHYLTTAQLDEYHDLTVKALILDFVFPFLLGVVLPAKSIKGATNYKDEMIPQFNDWWKLYGSDTTKLLGATVPGVLDKLYRGRVTEAFSDVLVALAASETARNFLIKQVFSFVSFALYDRSNPPAGALIAGGQILAAGVILKRLLASLGVLSVVC
jgi:hypothetical protein